MNDMMFLGLGYIGAGVGAGLTLIGAGLGIGKMAASAGDKVSETKAEITVAPAMVMANCR